MPDLNQDVQKAAADVKSAEQKVDAAGQRALNAVNREASWIEKHPKLALGIAAGLVAIVVALIVHAL